MQVSKAYALELLDRQIAVLHEKRRTATSSSRSYVSERSTYHGAVVLLSRLFDADAAESFRRHFTSPPPLGSLLGSSSQDRSVDDFDEYDEMLRRAILLLEWRQDAIRDSWLDDVDDINAPDHGQSRR